MMKSRGVLVGAALVWALIGVLPAWATQFNWTFQSVENNPYGPSKQLAAVMRVGATWPTVFYDGSNAFQNRVVASSLSPAGWWPVPLQTSVLPEASFVRSTPGSDGRAGVAWKNGDKITFAQSSRLGWQKTTVATLNRINGGMDDGPDVAYLSGNRPVVAYHDPAGDSIKVAAYDNLVWTTDTMDVESGNSVAMDIDSLDRIGLAYNTGSAVRFAMKDLSVGSWLTNTVRTGAADQLSIAFGPNNETGIAMLTGGDLAFAWFSTQSGQWEIDTLASGVTSQRVNLAFNSQGYPALAYVSESGTLARVHYRVNDGNGWADAVLPFGTDPDSGLDTTPFLSSDAALAFDGNDVPVIAFYNGGSPSKVLLAYDPLAPEPASALLLLGGLAVLSLRRRTMV